MFLTLADSVLPVIESTCLIVMESIAYIHVIGSR